MALYIGVHNFPDQLPEGVDLKDSWENYKNAASEMGLKPLNVLINKEKHVAYCQTEAESEDQVKQAHEKAQVPVNDVFIVEKWD